jgi:hypothetical protein
MKDEKKKNMFKEAVSRRVEAHRKHRCSDSTRARAMALRRFSRRGACPAPSSALKVAAGGMFAVLGWRSSFVVGPRLLLLAVFM